MKLIKEFASKFETIYIVEELILYGRADKGCRVKCIGKELIPAMYELNPDIVAKALLNKENETKKVDAKVVGRPPVLCPGCPHRDSSTQCPRRKTLLLQGISAAIH